MVFISYRHESVAHRTRVVDFALRLEAEGIHVLLDQFAQEREFNGGGPDVGWPHWSTTQAGDPAHKVLIIASPGWFRCFERQERPGAGLGAAAEAVVIEQRLYNAGGQALDIRLVTLDQISRSEVPISLQPYHSFRDPEDFPDLCRWLGSTPARHSRAEPGVDGGRSAVLLDLAARWLRPAEALHPLHVRGGGMPEPPVRVSPAAGIWNLRGPMNLPEVECAADPEAVRPLNDVAAEHPIMVLRGPPGAGKTTACRMIGRHYAAKLRQGSAAPVPVLVELRHFAPHGDEPAVEALERLIARATRDTGGFAPEAEASAAEGRRLIHHGFHGVPIAFFFDGLNEVGTAHSRAAHDALRQVLERLRAAGMRAIVTTRRHGAEVRALGNLEIFDLQPLEPDEIRAYLSQQMGWPPERATRLYEDELGPRLRLVAGNPLVLNLLCEIVRAGRAVPRSRGELFYQFASFVLEREEALKPGDFGQRRFSAEYKRRALEELAYQMQGAGRRLPERTVLEVFGTLPGPAPGDPHGLLDELCRNEFLTRTEGVVAFAHHHTFQELFCASAMLRRLEGRRLDLGRMARDARWWEPFAMMGGMMDEPGLDALVGRLGDYPALAGMLLGNARPDSRVEGRFTRRAHKRLGEAIRRTVVMTQGMLWGMLAVSIGLCVNTFLAGFVPSGAVLARWLGVDPIHGLPLSWVVPAQFVFFIAIVSSCDWLEAQVVQIHDVALGRAYDRWIEPWLLALHYLHSPDSERALEEVYAEHRVHRAVDLRLRRYLEGFCTRTLQHDPDALISWLDDPEQAQLAVLYLGGLYDNAIAVRLIERIAKSPDPAGHEIAILEDWLAHRPESREPLSLVLRGLVEDTTLDARLRRAVARLLRRRGLPAPRVPYTTAEIAAICATPLEWVLQPLVSLVVMLLGLVVRRRLGPAYARIAPQWARVPLLQPGPSGFESMATRLSELRQIDAAEAVLDAALRRHPRHAGLLTSRGHLLRVHRCRYPQAALAYSAALGTRPDDAGLLWARSLSLRRAGRLEEALRDARRVHAQRPGDAGAWECLIDVLGALGEHEEAESLLDQALRQFPRDLGILACRGHLLHNNRRRYLEAAAAYTAAIEVHPNAAWLLHCRSSSLRAAGRFEEAIQDARQALLLEPGDVRSSETLIDALIDAGRTEEAESLLAQALRQFPRDLELLACRGHLLHNTRRRYLEAAAAYTAALEIHPNTAWLLRCRSNSLRLAGCLEEAIKDARQALLLAPGNVRSWGSLCEVLCDAGEADEAESLLDRALQRFPGDAELLVTRGDLLLNLRALGREAMEVYKTVLRIQPNEPRNLRNLAYAALSEGDVATATGLCDRVIALDALSPFTVALEVKVATDLGDPNRALARACAKTDGSPWEMFTLDLQRALLALARGRAPEASDLLDQGLTHLCGAQIAPTMIYSDTRALRAEIALCQGQPSEARRALAAAGPPWTDAIWAGFLAFLSDQEGGDPNNFLVIRLRRLRALHSGAAALRPAVQDLPAAGIHRLTRQCALWLDAAIATEERRDPEVIREAWQRARALSWGDAERLDHLLAAQIPQGPALHGGVA